jgi:hypothetical protein
VVLTLMCILALHLRVACLIWKSASSKLPISAIAKLSLFSAALWVVGSLIFTIVHDPWHFLFGFLSDSQSRSDTFDNRILYLTLGLPSSVLGDLNVLGCGLQLVLFWLLLIAPLFALGLLPLLARRGYGSSGFLITLLTLWYAGVLFGGGGVADVTGEDSVWIAVWAVGGAGAGFSVKVAQTLIKRRLGVENGWPSEKLVLGWLLGGAMSAIAGLLIGTVGVRGALFYESTPTLLLAIATGLVVAALAGLITALAVYRPQHAVTLPGTPSPPANTAVPS